MRLGQGSSHCRLSLRSVSIACILGVMASDTRERALSGLRVIIDREVCIASRNCIHIAFEVFALDDESVVAFKPDASDIERERLIDACRSCPVSALTVIDEQDRQLVP